MDTRKRRKEGTARTPSLESLQASPKRARVHAQRKFAQGSQPNSPAPTPVKETRELRERSISTDTRTRATAQTHPPPPPALDIVEVPGRPTVEDFLTFLCYRWTALLPPGLEHFNTPQILEINADSRSQSPARDDKSKPTKKKQDAPLLDKKEKELSKVTRSTPQPPQAPADSRKLSKRLLVKKALLIKSKAKNLRIQVITVPKIQALGYISSQYPGCAELFRNTACAASLSGQEYDAQHEMEFSLEPVLFKSRLMHVIFHICLAMIVGVNVVTESKATLYSISVILTLKIAL
nr:uncharacterized protein LOC113802971 [Penaeus vannamei]